MTDPDIILLAIRGTVNPPNLDATRQLHNATAGHPDGVAAARSLGDLSHNVFVPLADAPDAATELLFIDLWNSAEGLQRFFSDKQVQEGGNAMFKHRDPAVFRQCAARSFHLPTPRGKNDRFLGVLRATVKSESAAIAAFDAIEKSTINAARKAGQVSHHVFFRLGEPALDMISIQSWMDGGAMADYYKAGHGMTELEAVLAGPPVTSMWKQPPGSWVEW
jgi:hypothetical protein